MPYYPANIPLQGWITDSPFSDVPPGFTHDMLNMFPTDPFRRRLRLATRPGFNRTLKPANGVQCMVRCICFVAGVRKDRVYLVRGGKVYYFDAGGAETQVLGPASTTAAALSTSGRVEGVQRGLFLYLVDGLFANYTRVKIDQSPDPTWERWTDAGAAGPEDLVKIGTTAGASLIALYGSRLALAGVKGLENIWFMSSVNDPDLFTPATADSLYALGLAGNVGPWGTPGDQIVAMFPMGQQGMVFAGSRSISMLTSDPAVDSNAAIISLSRSVGLVGPRAYAVGQNDAVYVLAQDGLYLISPNDFAVTEGQRVSRNRLDSYFSQVKWDDIDAVLHYDIERRGLWIFLTRTDQPTSSVHFFFSEQTGGFFPFRLYDPLFYGAYSVCQAPTTDGRNQIALMASNNAADSIIGYFDQKVLAGIDGYASSGADSALNPSSTSVALGQQIASRVSFGPLVPPLPGRIMVKEVHVELGADTYLPDADVKADAANPTCTLRTADTSQEAIADTLASVRISEVEGGIEDGGGSAEATTPDDGGDSSTTFGATYTSEFYLDSGFAGLAEQVLTTQDSFVAPEARVFEDDNSEFELIRVSFLTQVRWVLRRQDDSTVVLAQQAVNGIYDEDPSVGEYLWVTYIAGTPVELTDTSDEVAVSEFEGLTETELGDLTEGMNNRLRCRVRAGAAFVRISSSGYPFAIERVGIDAAPAQGPHRAVQEIS